MSNIYNSKYLKISTSKILVICQKRKKKKRRNKHTNERTLKDIEVVITLKLNYKFSPYTCVQNLVIEARSKPERSFEACTRVHTSQKNFKLTNRELH